MSSAHEYKRFENKIVQKVKDAAVAVVFFIGGLFRGLGRFLTRRYTVVFVPHSEKRVYNLHITVLSFLCFLLVASGILGAFVLYGSSYSSTMYELASKDGRLRDAQGSLDQLRDETSSLYQEFRKFDNALSPTLKAMGVDIKSSQHQDTPGDLSSILNLKEAPEGVLQEVDDIRRILEYISQAIEPIKKIGDLLDTRSELLTEIPSVWPVRNGVGNITMFFGQNINPFSGQYYIHKGIDIATFRSGDPVVATADGQVVTIDYTSDFGNYIIIKHKHGYYTRYAHLLSFRVKIGQRVQQNEVIGYIGSTGLSTGPHLHYEVHVGSDVVDPYKYINIRSSVARQGR
ncbi:MAG: M23 family metallopeptidase [Treponema sp.]|nr:M23 family metallopeptidase [Treponema sp.]